MRWTRKSLTSLTATAMTVAAISSAGTASAASAPNVTGTKYGEASATLTSAGFEPVVSTTVGDRTAWSNCLVTSQHQHNVAPPPNSRGPVRHQVLVGLNCGASVASVTKAGPSAASPQGRAAKAAATKSGS